MGLLQTLGASIDRVLPTGGGVGTRFRRLVIAAYAIFLLFLLAELARLAFAVDLPGVLRPVFHGLASISLVVALTIGAFYYVASGSVWPST